MEARELAAVQEHSPAIIPVSALTVGGSKAADSCLHICSLLALTPVCSFPSLALQITKEQAGPQPPLVPPTVPAACKGGGVLPAPALADADDARSEGDAWELLSRSMCGSHGGSPRSEHPGQQDGSNLPAAEVARRLAEAARQGQRRPTQLPLVEETTLATNAGEEGPLAGNSPRSTGSVGLLDERHEVYSISQVGWGEQVVVLGWGRRASGAGAAGRLRPSSLLKP